MSEKTCTLPFYEAQTQDISQTTSNKDLPSKREIAKMIRQEIPVSTIEIAVKKHRADIKEKFPPHINEPTID